MRKTKTLPAVMQESTRKKTGDKKPHGLTVLLATVLGAGVLGLALKEKRVNRVRSTRLGSDHYKDGAAGQGKKAGVKKGRIVGKWHAAREKVKEKWGDLTAGLRRP